MALRLDGDGSVRQHALELAERLRDATSLNEIAQAAVDYTNEVFDVDFTSVYLWDPPAGVLRLQSYRQQSHWAPQSVFMPGSGVFGTAFSSAKTVRVGDYSKFGAKTARALRQGIVSGLATPVLCGGEAIAVLGIGGRVRDRFSEEDERAIEAIAAQLAPRLAEALKSPSAWPAAAPAWRSMARDS